MKKVIWSCWLQGRQRAPWLVDRCLASWETMNPGWELRCLDQHSLRRFVDIPDLRGKRVTRTSFSDIARILLLKEYGGIWTDATALCHRPLDEWLGASLVNGFFAFDRPGGDRMLASWFLASSEQNYIVDQWCTSVLAYWAGRTHADSYFWFHELFRQLVDSDAAFAAAWNAVPKVSASGPHSVQSVGMLQTSETAILTGVDWRCPVFKLTHRFDQRQCVDGTLLARLIGPAPLTDGQIATPEEGASSGDHSAVVKSSLPLTLASLRGSANNLEDHIQLLAGLRLLRTLGVVPDFRAEEIASCEPSPVHGSRVPILLNIWFNANCTQWPPGDSLAAMSLGIQLRLLQYPELLFDTTAAHYRNAQPVNGRYSGAQQLRESRSIECFVNDCLTISFPRRREAEIEGSAVFVISRDRCLLDILPAALGDCTYINSCSDSFGSATNVARAGALLETCRTQARLIITTCLHCALAAIGMGIPVVVFYPDNEGAAHQADRERFRALDGLVAVHSFREVDLVDWQPRPVDMAAQKLAILDHFFAMAEGWPTPTVPIGPFAPASELPPSTA